MTQVCDYIAKFLRQHGVTDAFGIPGGVILDLMYAFDRHGVTPHLSYHEQAAGFAAAGYAQASDKVGVAYATRGPGFTNLITPIADAYYDSIPVLFFTAHAVSALPNEGRLVANQEMDTCGMVRNITKYAVRIDRVEDVIPQINKAWSEATSGRKGPVLIDIATCLFRINIDDTELQNLLTQPNNVSNLVELFYDEVNSAKRPVLLVGDGINQSNTREAVNVLIEKLGLPVLSSRFAHDVVKKHECYYGYIGSYACRYANFILSKADLIVVLGNRLGFPANSESYSPITRQAKFLRFDIDANELSKHHNMQQGHIVNLPDLITALVASQKSAVGHEKWIACCDKLRQSLWCVDVIGIHKQISDILQIIPDGTTVINDVGNHACWVSRASAYSKTSHRTLYSKSFGALGCALGKAIGAFYSTRRPVLVFTGDQGLQMNIQELQFIAQHRLPICIVVLNNHASGMIKDRERAAGFAYSLNTTLDSGYSVPNFDKLAKAYGIEVLDCVPANIKFPVLMNLSINHDIPLAPTLPNGRPCQDMEPRLSSEIFIQLNELSG